MEESDLMRSISRSRPLPPLFLAVLIDMLGIGIAIPVLAIMFLDPRQSILAAGTPDYLRTVYYGLLLGMYPLTQFFGAPVLGALSDRYGRKPLLQVSFLGTLAGYALFAVGIMTKNIPLLFFSRAVDGFTGGNISIAFSSIADFSSEKDKPKNFGLVGMAFGLGFILGPFIGGKLSDPGVAAWFSLATPFWFAAALSGLNMVALWLLFPETLHEKRDVPVSALTGFRQLRKAASMPRLRLMFLVVFLITLGFNFFTQFFQVLLIQKFHFGQGDIGTLFAFIGICIAVTQGALTRPVSARFRAKGVFSLCTLLLGLTLLALILPFAVWQIYILNGLIALFQGLSQPNITTIISNLSDRRSQGEIMGINQAVVAAAMTLPPLIGAFITGMAIYLPLLVAGTLTLIAWALFRFGYSESTV
jgi:DHA1 family tetracycline resistance protein-like MFS transporter